MSLTAHPRATLAACILGSSLAFIDGSVVNVALPALASDLRADATSLPWAINAYLLPVGALTLLGGSLGDHGGRRRLFLVGLVTFTVASVLCAAAPAVPWLLAGRGLQGLGAALLMPNSLALLGSEFDGEARGRAIGTWSAVGALAGALGPVVGGWLVGCGRMAGDFSHQRPPRHGVRLSGAALRARPAGGRGGTLRSTRGGAALVTMALGLLTWSLTEAAGGGRSHVLLRSAAATGVVLFAAFIVREHRLKERALMPPALLRGRSFIGLNLLTFFLYGSLGGLIVLLPYLLIRIEGWSALAAGASLLPVPVVIGLASRSHGTHERAVRRTRTVILGGARSWASDLLSMRAWERVPSTTCATCSRPPSWWRSAWAPVSRP